MTIRRGWAIRMIRGKAFEEWGDIIKENTDRQQSPRPKSPHASLIEFHRDDPKRTYKD